MKLKSLFATVILFFIINNSKAQHPADFMAKGKWGVMHHFLADFKDSKDPVLWDKLISEFDVQGLVNQLSSVHVGWVIFTIGQNSGYYCSPNSVYDNAMRYTQSHCSKRDLIADLADALNEKGIPLIVYIPFGFMDSHDPKNYWYPDMIREYSNRWGNKIKGWWLDGYYGYVEMLPTMANAALSGNSNAVLAFNPGLGVNRSCEFENYTAGEYNDILNLKCTGRWKDGAQWHCVTKNTFFWGEHAETEEQKMPLYSDKEIVDVTFDIVNKGGAITWNTDLLKNGQIHPDFYRMLSNINNAVSSVKNSPSIDNFLNTENFIKLSLKANQNLAIGENTKIQVFAMSKDSGFINVTGMVEYKLSNTKIGQINSHGIFIAKSAGDVDVTVQVGNKKASIALHVVPHYLSDIHIRANKNIAITNEIITIDTKGIMNDGSIADLKNAQFNYSINNSDIAVINDKGKITTLKAGRILITTTVTLNNVSKTAILPLVIKDNQEPRMDELVTPPFISKQSQTNIIIDGEVTEKIWTETFEYPLCYNQRTRKDYSPPAEDNIKASFMLAYRGDTLFGVIKRFDDVTYTNNCLFFVNDGVEIYLEMDGLFKQMNAIVGKDFNGSFNNGFSKIVWNSKGTIGEFAIQIPGLYLSGQRIHFNLDVVDNDNTYKIYQLFPINGYATSFLGRHLAQLMFVEK